MEEVAATRLKRQINVMIVDDSSVMRGIWRRIINAQPDFSVILNAENGKEALSLISTKPVDVIILDVEMPEMDGLTALPLLLKAKPDVKVIVASALTNQGSRTALQALTLGASDFIEKKSASGAFETVGRQLVEKIRALVAKDFTEADPSRDATAMPQAKPMHLEHVPQVLAIGSSTGGPNALVTVLKGLPRHFHSPILLVQHMPAFFITALAERLTKETGRPCVEGKNGMPVEEDHIYIAPGEYHMTVEKGGDYGTLKINQNEPENFCRPAVDPLFRSAAQVYQNRLLALVLTGMGEDGKKGAEEVKNKGGHIIAQDEATSVVWGMPGAVARAGLAAAVLPLDLISASLIKLFGVADK